MNAPQLDILAVNKQAHALLKAGRWQEAEATLCLVLAGALGRPAWVMLPFVPDWRWLLKREDTPWYPSLKLFRQPAEDDWPSVMQALRADLDRLVANTAHMAR